LPIKLNFAIQKNKKTLFELAQDIEKTRIEIASSHGALNEETGQYEIRPEELENAQKELIELLEIEQEVSIYTITADSLSNDFVLTTSQIEAIMFMIEEA
jgi:hypothetical protein